MLTTDEIDKIQHRPTENLDAYDSYLNYKQLVASGGGNLREKIALLEEAVTHDPGFAEAWAQLAIEYIFTWETQNREEAELRTKAYDAIEQAKRQDPNIAFIPYALSSFAMRESRDPEESVSYLSQALSLDPGFYLAHWRLVHRYHALGMMPEAQKHAEIAVRMNPLDFAPNWDLLVSYQRQRLWENAYALIEKNTEASISSQWPLLRMETEYLETGSMEAFTSSLESLQWPNQLLVQALIDRDYANALIHLRARDGQVGFHFFSESNFQLSHSVIIALIHFIQDERDNWRE